VARFSPFPGFARRCGHHRHDSHDGDLCAASRAARSARTDALAAIAAASSAHWLGTDKLGRDVFSRIVYGARTSIAIGFVAVGVAISLGTLIGLIAGYAGGRVENV